MLRGLNVLAEELVAVAYILMSLAVGADDSLVSVIGSNPASFNDSERFRPAK